MSSLMVDIRVAGGLAKPAGAARDALLKLLGEDADLALLRGGASASIGLGELGTALDGMRSALPSSPEALVGPLLQALESIAGRLHLPAMGDVGEVLDTIRMVHELFAKLLAEAGPAIDAGRWGQGLGQSIGDVANLVVDRLELAQRIFPQARLTAIGDILGGLSGAPDVAGVVDALAGVLLPLPIADLRLLRVEVDGLDARLTSLPGMPAGLEVALEGWAVALDALVRVDAAGRGAALAQVRSAAESLDTFLGRAVEEARAALSALDLEGWGAKARGLAERLPDFPRVSLDRVSVDLAREIDGFVAHLDGVADAQISAGLTRFRSQAQAWIEASAFGQVPRLLDELERLFDEWLKGLPHRIFRQRLQAALGKVIEAIRDLGIDSPPKRLESALGDVRALLQEGVVERVQAAFGGLKTRIDAAIGRVEALLGQLTAALDAVTGEVGAVLGRLRDALAAFRTSIEDVRVSIDVVDIAGAGARSAAELDKLRASVETLKSQGLVPDVLGPILEEAAEAVASVDLESLFVGPAREASAALRVELPPELGQGMREAAELVRNALPANLTAELDAPLGELAAALRSFDPSSLLAGVGTFLAGVAREIRALDPRPLAAPLEVRFRELLAKTEVLDPGIVLEPLAQVYDKMLALLDGVDATLAGDSLLGAMAGSGEPLGQVVGAAVKRLESAAGSAPGPSAPSSEPPAEVTEPPEGRPAMPFRPGDSLRALGLVLQRLKEVLEPVDAGVMVPALTELRALTAGLAARLAPVNLLGGIERRIDSALAALSLSSALPGRMRLEAGWRRAGIAHDLDAELAPATLFVRHAAALAALRADARAHLRALGGAADVLSRKLGGLELALPAGLRAGDPDAGVLRAFLDALDPEPVAAALDAAAERAVRRIVALAGQVGTQLEDLYELIRATLDRLGPGALFDRLARLLYRLRQELDYLNPRRLAEDVRPVFRAIRGEIEAWSPARMAQAMYATISSLADALVALDPATMLADLGDLDGLAARVEGLAPGPRLAPIVAALGEVADELETLDLGALVQLLVDVVEKLVAELGAALGAVQTALVALLNALGSGGASVQVDVTISIE